jgi:hypothetical protein
MMMYQAIIFLMVGYLGIEYVGLVPNNNVLDDGVPSNDAVPENLWMMYVKKIIIQRN